MDNIPPIRVLKKAGFALGGPGPTDARRDAPEHRHERRRNHLETSSRSEVRKFYEDTAESYAELMDSEIDLPVYAETFDRLAERIGVVPGPVVDTSCGPGHMLARYRERHDPGRAVIGIDLSPRMVALAGARLGGGAETRVGDMRDLAGVESDSAAAVISFFALHHVDSSDARAAFREWFRVLRSGGGLIVATWEGTGSIDYGEASDVVALRYTRDEVADWAREAGFAEDRCRVEPVEGLPMDAVYWEGAKE